MLNHKKKRPTIFDRLKTKIFFPFSLFSYITQTCIKIQTFNTACIMYIPTDDIRQITVVNLEMRSVQLRLLLNTVRSGRFIPGCRRRSGSPRSVFINCLSRRVISSYTLYSCTQDA